MRKTALIIGMMIILLACAILPASSAETVTIDLSNGMAEDTSLKKNFPTTKYGTDTYIAVGNYTPNDRRALIWIKDNYFDNNTIFNSVTLTLYSFGFTDDSANISVHALLHSFNEADATWNNATDICAWYAGGGDYDLTAITNTTVNGNGSFDFDITSIYREWANNYTMNLGIMLLETIDEPTTNIVTFYSTEYTTNASRRPKLTIDYTNPSTPTTSITADKWTWAGYVNTTGKTLATLYSEISDCEYVCAQNTTTGVYYTYGPGITDSFTVTYGMAVAVLCDSSSSWDHT